jgi:hypothetical protein
MAGCQSRSERPAGRLQSYQDCHGARSLYGPPRGKVAGANTFSWEELSSNGAGMYTDRGILIEVRAGGRLVAVRLEFARPPFVFFCYTSRSYRCCWRLAKLSITDIS